MQSMHVLLLYVRRFKMLRPAEILCGQITQRGSAVLLRSPGDSVS